MDTIELDMARLLHAARDIYGKIFRKRLWQAFFGMHMETVLILWWTLTASEAWTGWIFSPKHLLWTLYFLKVYVTEDVAASNYTRVPIATGNEFGEY